MVLGMTQKADKTLGLPVIYLRDGDADINALLSALRSQNLTKLPSSSIWVNLKIRIGMSKVS